MPIGSYGLSLPLILPQVNLTLDERLACGRDDRPLRRSVGVPEAGEATEAYHRKTIGKP